jgi:putative heme-binding domain-containing protein
VVPLLGQVQPTPEGHESPAAAAQRQAAEARSGASQAVTNPFESDEDVARGNDLFQTHCSYCHGAFGEGGRGADLTAGRYRLGGSDAELFQTIRNGIPGSEMGPPRVEDDDLWRIVGFVKKLGTAESEDAPGDAAAGKIVYEKTGCASCHIINGEGGVLGPDLNDVGRRRGLAFLEESIVKPEADLSNNYRGTRVVTQDGQTIAGIQLNEDDYSIQIRDTTGNPRSFLKHELKQIRRDDPSLMPAYGTILNETQLEDLVAYLSSLKGAQ